MAGGARRLCAAHVGQASRKWHNQQAKGSADRMGGVALSLAGMPCIDMPVLRKVNDQVVIGKSKNLQVVRHNYPAIERKNIVDERCACCSERLFRLLPIQLLTFPTPGIPIRERA